METTTLLRRDSTEENSINSQNTTGKIEGIQILRAVAVFLVTWLHAGQVLGDWRLVELPHFGAFGIDIFFVISGFIMSSILLRIEDDRGMLSSWRFLKRRLIRIFPIYWVFAFMELARLTRSYGYLETAYLPSFLLLPGLYPRFPMLVGVAWTMVFEMFFYYILAALLLVTVKRAVPVSIAFFCLAVLVGEVVHPQSPLWMTLSNPILLEFVCGAIIALAFQHFAKRRRLGIAMLVLGVAVSLYIQSHQGLVGAQGLVMVMSSQGVIRRVLTWGTAATLLVTGVVFWSPSSRSLVSRIAVAMGDSSYSAYLASSLLIEFTWRILRKLAGQGTPTLALEILFQCLITAMVLLVGWVSYKFVERPMLRWLQQTNLERSKGFRLSL